jgi:sugar O-acyltransferase (sialic acid O-acetyltransferase NeuD family)
MTKKIMILGTGGNCIDILDTIHDINAVDRAKTYECAGFLDDNKDHWGKEIHGVRVHGPLDSAPSHQECLFVNGIGSPFNFWMKKEIVSRTKVPDDRFETIIHPSAYVSSMAQIGHGTVVFQNVTITSNVQVGNHVIILPNSVISHGDVIGDYTCITGGVSISGNVTIGHSCYLGTNSALIGNIKIGNTCLVGMGSVVIGSVDDNSVVVGNPAKFLRKTISEKQKTETLQGTAPDHHSASLQSGR